MIKTADFTSSSNNTSLFWPAIMKVKREEYLSRISVSNFKKNLIFSLKKRKLPSRNERNLEALGSRKNKKINSVKNAKFVDYTGFKQYKNILFGAAIQCQHF